MILTACMSSHVLVGNPRPETSPDQVKVYLHPPKKYDEIAVLDSSSRFSLTVTPQAKSDKAIERMKTEAAKLGANGILLKDVANQQVGETGSSFAKADENFAYGSWSSHTRYAKNATGLAIYVEQE